MSRNSGGNYSLPLASVVTGTSISSTWANTTLGDLATEITNSLDRTGRGGMLAPLRGADGSAAAPTFSFSTDAGTGFYLAGASDLRVVMVASALQKWTPTAVTIYPATTIDDTLTVTGACTLQSTLAVTGNATLSGTLAVTGSTTTGALASTATLQASGTVGASNQLVAGNLTNGKMATTSGNNYPLAEIRGYTNNANNVRLTARAVNRATVTDWEQVGVGWSYDVDTALAAGGSFYLGKTGATLTGGTAATSGTPANALALTNGYLSLDGVTAPASTTAVKNTLTPKNICKAWVAITFDGSGNASIGDGFNVASVSQASDLVTVTFQEDFASASYCALATFMGTAGAKSFAMLRSKAAGSCTIEIWSITGNTFTNFSTSTRLDVACFGAQ